MIECCIESLQQIHENEQDKLGEWFEQGLGFSRHFQATATYKTRFTNIIVVESAPRNGAFTGSASPMIECCIEFFKQIYI
jgi:hypothetical protein